MNVTHMTCSLLIGSEGFIAFMTGKWMFASVYGHVYFQVGSMFEPYE